ncbi:MAG: hypothetical protein NC202_00415 [Roseburia sp.]|nr:hypothetical protein [Roseburia sp.]
MRYDGLGNRFGAYDEGRKHISYRRTTVGSHVGNKFDDHDNNFPHDERGNNFPHDDRENYPDHHNSGYDHNGGDNDRFRERGKRGK